MENWEPMLKRIELKITEIEETVSRTKRQIQKDKQKIAKLDVCILFSLIK